MQNFQDIEHFVKTLSAAIKKKIPTKVSQLTNDVGYKTTDTNTTYKISKSGSTVTLTGSDGSTTSVSDSNTTYSSLKNPYSLTIQNNGTTVASYDGSTAKTANFTNATTSANGLMSKSDKAKLDGIDPSAITTNAANIKKNADAISAETTRAKKAEEANANAIATKMDADPAPFSRVASTDINRVGFSYVKILTDAPDGVNAYGHIFIDAEPGRMGGDLDNKVIFYVPYNTGRVFFRLVHDGKADDWVEIAPYSAVTTLSNKLIALGTDSYSLVDFVNDKIQFNSNDDYLHTYLVGGVTYVFSGDTTYKSFRDVSDNNTTLSTAGGTKADATYTPEKSGVYCLRWYKAASDTALATLKLTCSTVGGAHQHLVGLSKMLATSSADGLMSAADKKAIDREFFRMLPKGGTVIPNGANLNSTAYLKVGNYYQSANVNTTNMTNIPFKAAFMMYVLSPLSEEYDNESTSQWVYRLRIFIEYTGTGMFVQTVSSGSTPGSFDYGPWVKMTNSNDLSAVSKIINDHIANKANPHGVTKAQVGLGSVANLDQSKAIKSITRSGTTFTATALDGTKTTFTQQDSNTTYSVATSSTDGLMSKSDKAKLDGISSGADAVTIKTVKVNGTALTPDSNKAVNVTVPTLANNATTTAGGMALDARMGKTLSDQIASVKTGAIDQIVNLTAAGWTGDAAPYSQTVNVTGMTEDLLCELFSACPKSATVAEREAYNEAFALVASGYAETANGSATFLVDEKPAIDIGVRLYSLNRRTTK